MRLAHLADLHLGFRQYEAHTPKGANQREADVALAVHRALDGVIAAQPEAVVVAGDVFHSVRPPNGAILTAFAELGRLRAALPEVPVLLLAGVRTESGTVVAKSAVWRVEGVRTRICSTSGLKPISSIRSAASSTKSVTLRSVSVPRPR